MPKPIASTPLENPLRNFTNREKERDVLVRILKLPPGGPLPVVMFYGVGGVGKSWLLRKLRELAADNHPFLPTALLDFEPRSGGTAYHADVSKSLFFIRQQLRKVPCPLFDLAYAWLRHKEGITEEPLLKGGGQAGEAFEVVKEAAGAAADTPGAGGLLGRLKAFFKDRFSGSRLERWLAERMGQDDFLRLRSMESQEIYPQLAGRLLRDLSKNLEEWVGHACRAVIFLDTFEAIALGLSGQAQRNEREAWVRELHASNSPVLLVIAGRDRLRWDECDPEYSDREYLEQHLVGGLSESDSRTFLASSNITDPLLQDAILRSSVETEGEPEDGAPGYHPFSLGLCADTVVNEIATGRTVDPVSFEMPPGDVTKLAQRFLKSLSDRSHEVWVRRLALTPRFDERAARAAFSPTPGAAQDDAWLTLHGYSFVQDTDEPGWWTLHAKMRDALATGPSAEADHSFWKDLWTARAKAETTSLLWYRRMSLAWYHMWRLNPTLGWQTWRGLTEQLWKNRQMADHLELLDWWEPTGLLSRSPATPDEAGMLDSLAIEYRRASRGDRVGNVRRAIACFEAALRVRTEAALPAAWAATQNNLGNAYSDLPVGDQGENLKKAIECYEAALRISTEAADPETWARTQNNLGIAHRKLPIGDRVGNVRRAIACFEAALRVRTEAALPAAWAATQNNLGNAYSDLPVGDQGENLKKAIECYEAALRVSTEATDPGAWGIAQHNLGNCYLKLWRDVRSGSVRKAIACFTAALRVRTQATFPQFWAMTMNSLGSAHSQATEGDRGVNLLAGITCFEAALSVFTEAAFPSDWSTTNYNLGLTLADLAHVVGDQTLLVRALAAFENASRGADACGIASAAEAARSSAEAVRALLAGTSVGGGSAG